MSAEDVYGFADPELETLRVQVEAALGVALAARYSSYHGGNYYLGKAPPQTRITLQRNFDEREREWALEGFPDSKALLFVEAPDSAAVDAIGEALVDHVPGLRRLRRQSIDPDTKKVLTTFYMDNRKDTNESRPDEWSEAV
jgi:hypothetical protein